MNALVIPLTLTKKDFATNAESARLDMERLKGEVGQVNAVFNVMQRETRAAGGATDEQKVKIQGLRDQLKALSKDLTTATADFKILSAQTPPTMPVAAPDESGRLAAHWAKQGELERSRSANEAIANTRLPMPTASAPNAVVKVAGAAEESAAGAARVGISRMGRQELGHVGRSIGGSLAAGMPIGNALEMEAPRLISALGPAVMSAVGGMGGLVSVLAPLTVGVAAAAAGFTIYNANQAAIKQRDANGLFGNVFNRGGDTVEGASKELEAAEKQEDATRKMRHSKRNRLANLAGLGLHDEDNEDIRQRKVGIRDRRDDAMERDAKFARRTFDGDQSVEQEKLKVDLADKIRQIRTSGVKDANRLVEIAKEEHQVAIDTLTRKQRAQAIALASEQDLLSIRNAGINVETESAAARVRAAQALLKNGPASGPEHDANANRLTGALVEQEQAKRNQASRAAAVVSEEKIVDIKRAGLDVDVKIAQERLKAAQGALDRNPAKMGVEYDELKKSVGQAQLEVEAATKATNEKKAQLDLETRIANLRGSSDQVRKQTLALEAAHLRELIHAAETTQDERRGYKKDLRQNRRQQDESDKGEKLRAIDTEEKEDRAHAGRGIAAQLELLGHELERNNERRSWNKKENGNDKDFTAGLDETAAHLKRTIEDLIFAEQQRIQALRNQDSEIKGRGYQPSAEANDRGIDAKYRIQIAQERHGNNDPAVLAGLERNRVDEHFENAVDEEQMTPAQKRARQRQNDRRAQAAARVRARQEHHVQAEAANHGNFSDFFYGRDRHTIGGHAQPNRQPVDAQPNREVSVADAAHKAAMDKGFKGQLGTVESLLTAIRDEVSYKER